MTRTLQITQTDDLCHVVLANADRCNALTSSYVAGLTELLQGFRLATDDAPAAVILSGVLPETGPGFFCSGADLADLQIASSGHYAARRTAVDALNALMRAVRACPCPVIAAVEGGADGAGVALALGCDLIIADEGARFSATNITAGLTPDAGLTLFLSAGVPRWLVAEMLFTATPVPVTRLYDLGVVNRLVPAGEAVTTAKAMAADLVTGSDMAIRATKALLAQLPRTSFDDQLEAEADAFATTLGSPDGQARLAACLARYDQSAGDKSGKEG